MNSIQIQTNSTTRLPANIFTNSGSTFIGWATSKTGPVVYQDEENFKMRRSNVTLYAKWNVNRKWFAIASSSDGTKLAGIVENDFIYTSTDPFTSWTARKLPDELPRYWYAIASSNDGTKLAAVASNDYIYTSSDSGAT